MSAPSFQDPVFATYAIAAALMILKASGMSWLVVARMIQENAGFRSPEDLRKTVMNPEPRPDQTAPNERVERIRRIQLNDSENLPYFLVAGFLFVLTAPSLLMARTLLYGYVVFRFLHFAAYLRASNHETRAFFWTMGWLLHFVMICRVLIVALGW